jgi:adenylyltransferase/sulfurtransferase
MVQQITVQDLAKRLAAGEPTYLLDVRQPWEHDAAVLPKSTLVPLDQLDSHIDEVTPPEGALVVAYCHHGVRSLSAAAILERHGFANVVSLMGGIDQWSLRIDPMIPRY